MNTNVSWSEFVTLFESWPVWLRVIVIVLAVYQIGMEFWALVDVLRRKPELVNGPKLLWGLLIIMVNLLGIGAIIYFFAGRKEAAALDTIAGPETADRAKRAADVLYGDKDPQ